MVFFSYVYILAKLLPQKELSKAQEKDFGSRWIFLCIIGSDTRMDSQTDAPFHWEFITME